VTPLSPIHAVYPPIALRARLQTATVIVVSAFIDENGQVTDAKVLKGDPHYGFNEEAIRAIRAARFSPPRKDGKRVKTWRPQAISFTP